MSETVLSESRSRNRKKGVGHDSLSPDDKVRWAKEACSKSWPNHRAGSLFILFRDRTLKANPADQSSTSTPLFSLANGARKSQPTLRADCIPALIRAAP